MSVETPVSAQKADHIGDGDTEGESVQSFATTMDKGELFLVSQENSVALLDTGATANLAFSRWLARHNRILDRYGIERVFTCSSKATFRLGDRRLGEVRHEADIPVGGAGNKGAFTAFALDADISAVLRKGAMEDWAGSWIFLRIAGFTPTGGEDTPEGESSGTLYPGRGRFCKDPSRSLPRPESPAPSRLHRGVCHAPSLEGSGSVRRRSAFALLTGRPVPFPTATHLCGLQGGYPWGCGELLPDGPEEDSREVACELGSCVGATIGAGFGGFVGG